MASSLADTLDFTPDSAEATPSRARTTVLKRLADVVCLPSSRVNAFERSMTADLIVEVLRGATSGERARVARRLGALAEIPNPLCRLMLRDVIEVAAELLQNSPSLREDDLLDCIRTATAEHRRLIAQRRGLGEAICDALVDQGEIGVLELVVRNDNARLGYGALEALVAASQHHPSLVPLLIRRSELRPAHAYALFWWADSDLRTIILQRFAVSREVLQDAVSDVFALAAGEGWQDEPARKALQFIERRQRNRAALDKSPFDSLESAVAAAAGGLTREIAEEIAYLSGVRPPVGAKIMSDPGGEPLAILCKSTGLPRGALAAIWRGLKRPDGPALARVLTAYDMLAVDRAQTVLRYWNWSLSSAIAPTAMSAIDDAEDAIADYPSATTTPMLAFS